MVGDGRTKHSATQAFGLALIAASLVAVVILTVVALGGDDIALPVALALVSMVSAIVVWKVDRPWARAVGVTGTVISLGLSYMALGVVQPFSPVEFPIGLTYVFGVSLAFVGGIRAIRAGRRGDHGATHAERRLRMVVLSIIGVAAVASAAGFALTREKVGEADAAGVTTLTMNDMAFEPGSTAVPAGGRLLVHNADPFVHDLTVSALGIKVTVGPGNEAIVDLDAAAPGTYPLVCSLHSADGSGMIGTLVIRP